MRSNKSNKSTMFDTPINQSLESSASKILQLTKLKKATAEYLKIHNEVVEQLWEVQRQIGDFKKNQPEADRTSLERAEKIILECLEKSNSAETIHQKMQEIYALEKEVNPEMAHTPDSPSFLSNLLK